MDEIEKRLLNSAIGAVIRGERTKRGLSRQDLSERSGIKFETVKSIETGRYKVSAVDMTFAAQGLGMSPVELVDDVMEFYEELREQEGLPRATPPSSR